MNKQRNVLITTTYNEMGIIIDTKAEEVAQPEPCEDTVSRQRLLSDLKELVAAWKNYPAMAEQIKGVETAIGYVGAIPPAQPEPHWISCSERLPELDEDGYSDKVLVCFSNFTGCEVCEYRECDDCHGWYVGDSDDNPEDVGVHVIAWMPLPEPYRGESE